MFRLLIDTSVWIDLATQPREQALLGALEQSVHGKEAELLVPQTVVDEFARNREKTLKTSAQRMTAALRNAREVVEQVGSKKDKRLLTKRLRDFSQKVPLVGNTPQSAVARIEKLLAGSTVIAVSDAVKLRAAARAIDGKAPCHTGRNSINDAILIEVYADALAAVDAKGKRFMFVTKNKADFSDVDSRKPHPDMAALFSRIRSRYFISLKDALQVLTPETLDEIRFISEEVDQPRVLSEILEAMDDLYWKVWFNRNANQIYKVRRGLLKVVDKEPHKHGKEEISKASVKLMRDSMVRVLKKRGASVAGPWDDFEWGMLNGKLSALRWVLGDEWDMLDT